MSNRKVCRYVPGAAFLLLVCFLGLSACEKEDAAAEAIAAEMSGRGNSADSGNDSSAETAEESGEVSESTPPVIRIQSEKSSSEETTSSETPEKEVVLTFVGDCTLGGDPTIGSGELFDTYYAKYGPEYFFENVRDVFAEDDITMINLEGTFTSETRRADKKYAFRSDPSCVDVLPKSSIEVANLANNHSRDYGEKSYTDTVDALNSAGVRWVCDSEVAVIDVGGFKVGIAGIYELPRLMGADEIVQADIAKLREMGAEFICIEFHWGIEGNAVPDKNQVALAHSAIDGGADLVVGSHPHVLQGLETYQGKPIVYSMGNFCFGGNSNPKDKDTMIYQLTVILDDAGNISGTGERVIPCRLSSVTNRNDLRPTILTGEEGERVLGKIRQRSEEAAAAYGTTADTGFES